MVADTLSDGRCRLDKWLWAARFYKTRSLATDAIDGGKIHVDGDRVKPAKEVRVGQVIQVRRKDLDMEVVVKALSVTRRGAHWQELRRLWKFFASRDRRCNGDRII